MKNIYVIPTDKPSRVYKELGIELKYTTKYFEQKGLNILNNSINQNIYITNDEEIKEGDWNLPPSNIPVKHQGQKFKGDEPLKCWKKIILTTDQDLINDGVQAIDNEFLEWFVKNPSCEDVEVESNYRVKSGTIQEHNEGKAGYEYYEYKITMPKQKQHKYRFDTDNGRVKIYVDNMVMLEFNQIDYLGRYAFKDDVNLYGITFHFLREGAGGYSFDFYAKTREHWESVIKLLDENM